MTNMNGIFRTLINNRYMKNKFAATMFLSALLALFSCSGKSRPNKVPEDTVNVKMDSLKTQYDIPDEEITHTDSTIIKWKDCSVSFQELYFFKEGEEGIIFEKDTVTVWSELGTSTQDSWIGISSEKLTDIKVEECYETSITIQNEGPHCDLIDWKHFTSEWKSLKKNDKGNFITLSFTEEETNKFPSVKMDDLRKAVKKHCDKHWHDLVKDTKSPTDYPSAVGISRLFIRITAINKETNTTVVKTVIIITPMGC